MQAALIAEVIIDRINISTLVTCSAFRISRCAGFPFCWSKYSSAVVPVFPGRRETLVSWYSNICGWVLSFPLNDNIALAAACVSSVGAFTLVYPTCTIPVFPFYQRNINVGTNPHKRCHTKSPSTILAVRREMRTREFRS